MQLKFCIMHDKIYNKKRKIVNCEKMESVTSHDLYPPSPLSQTVTLFSNPPPPPLERDILYGRPFRYSICGKTRDGGVSNVHIFDLFWLFFGGNFKHGGIITNKGRVDRHQRGGRVTPPTNRALPVGPLGPTSTLGPSAPSPPLQTQVDFMKAWSHWQISTFYCRAAHDNFVI